MIAVLFEAYPSGDSTEDYLRVAEEVREFLTQQSGFISIERFQSLSEEGKILSLSFWESEEHIEQWRNVAAHRLAQQMGRDTLYLSYRIRVATVTRDYTEKERSQAPADSNEALGAA